MSPVRWGSLIAAALPPLLAGCTRGEAARPDPAPSASAPSPPGLSPFEPVLEPPPFINRNFWLERFRSTEQRVAYGKGEMVVQRFAHHGEGEARIACPLALGPGAGCGTFTIGDQPPRQLPQPWGLFAGGQSAVFALVRCGRGPELCPPGVSADGTLYRIGHDGAVSVFARDPSLRTASSFWVVDTGERAFVLQTDAERGVGVAEALASGPGQPRSLSGRVALPMASMRGLRQTASGARSAARHGRKAMADEPSFVALPAEGSWAMAWLEVVPPPPGVGRAPSEHSGGCGGPPSRALSDRHIRKKAHLTRFEGTRQVDDRVVWSDDALDPETTRVVARLVGDKIEVRAERFARGPQGGSGRSFPVVPDELAVTASFDPKAGEGLVVFRAGDRLFFRRFDGQARYLGPTLPYLDLVEPDPATSEWDGFLRRPTLLARAAGRWIAAHEGGHFLVSLEERTAPVKTEPSQTESAVGFVSGDPHALLVTRDEEKIRVRPIDRHAKPAGPAVEVLSVPESLGRAELRVVQMPDAPPMVVARQGPHRKAEGPRYAWAWLKQGSPWNEPPAQALDLSPWGGPGSFLQTHGDVVVAEAGPTQQRLSWLRSGRTVEPPSTPRLEPWAAPWGLSPGWPLLRAQGEGGKALALHPGPAGLVAAPGLPGQGEACHAALPTGADTLVLVCTRAVDPVEPGVQVGLRALRLGEAPPQGGGVAESGGNNPEKR